MSDAPEQYETHQSQQAVENKAMLTEAVRHVDVVHTSLVGMTSIVVILLFALSLPIFGQKPVTHPAAFIVMMLVSFVGIGGSYYLNFRVHKHVTDQSRLTEVLVNSLGQGFLLFGKNGICGNVYSQACIDLLETIPSGKHIAEVLRVEETQASDLKEWLEVLFQSDHALGFNDVIKFLPQFFMHSQQRRISLFYRPIHDKEARLLNVVVIATDQTEEYMARQNAKKQQNFAEMICRIFKDRNQFQSTLAYLREFLDSSKNPIITREEGVNLVRQMHTLKATVKQFNLTELSDVIHEVESDMRSPSVKDDETFRDQLQLGQKKITDALLKVTEEVGSLIGGENELRGNMREIEEEYIYEFAREMGNKNADPVLVQNFLSNIIAVPVRDCFRMFEREIQDLAGIMDKQVKPIKFVGNNPRVLARPMQDFIFSLTHICRNIVDHGIELPITRMGRGKDPAGQVTIMSEIIKDSSGTGEVLHIIVNDDGNGIDPSKIRSKLSVQDPEGSWRFEDDNTIIQRIFSWGFTTKEELTTISGRGVGMEAVEREIKLLGGSISVSSELYNGASFDIKLPYRLDISSLSKSKSV